MKRGQLLITGIIVFFVCCSMSKCNTPGPETTVHGIVIDTVTGKPVSGLEVKVSNFDSSTDQYTPVVTNTDGSYNLSFKPSDKFDSYNIVVAGNSAKSYFSPLYTIGEGKITLGQDNKVNLTVYKLVDVTINLNSTINKNQPKLEVAILGITFDFQAENVTSAIVDTTYHVLIPRLNNYNIIGSYFDPKVTGISSPNDFSSYVYIGNADTTINITNP